MRLATRCRIVRSVDVAAEVGAVWQGVIDWPRHGDWVPLTTVRTLTPSGRGVGARFVGRTAGPGPLSVIGFDDVMEVRSWQDPDPSTDPPTPGRCEVVKLGRVVRGSAAFEVSAAGPGRSRVRWVEDIVVPRLVCRLVAVIAGAGLDRVLRAMARDLEGSSGGRAEPGDGR